MIIEKLKVLQQLIRGISIRYAYDAETDFHLIEIPLQVRTDDRYLDWEVDFWATFDESTEGRETDCLITNESVIRPHHDLCFEAVMVGIEVADIKARYGGANPDYDCEDINVYPLAA